MLTKTAQKYDIDSIISFITRPENRNRYYHSEEELQEFKATILEYIHRKEATIQILNNKVVGFSLN